MPSPFDITVATNTVNLDNKREGIATFTAHNNTRRRLRAAARLTTQPPEAEKWLTILPPDDGSVNPPNMRDFPIDSTQQYQVRIAVPMDAPPGSYTMKLTVADEMNPDDNFTESPEVMFTVREVQKETPPSLPGWLIPAVIIAVLVIVGIIAAVVLSNRPEPTPTPLPPTAEPTVVAGDCLITLTGAQFVYSQPDTISNSMFDQLAAGATLKPIGKSADNAWWNLDYYNTWIQTSLFATTANLTGNCNNLPVVCLLAITSDVTIYTRPVLTQPYTQAHAGWQFVPTGKLANNSWWQTSYQDTWVPTNVFGIRAVSSGDCTTLPVVPPPP